MNVKSQNAIIKALSAMPHSLRMIGAVKVVINNKNIDISFDGRKCIGRVRLELQDNKYIVYFMKKEGDVLVPTTAGAYMAINDVSEAKLFVKWYEITIKLAAMKRPRK